MFRDPVNVNPNGLKIIDGPPAAEPDDAGPWDTVLAALRTLRNVEILDDWPAAPQPAGRAAAVHTPVTFRPFEFPGMAAPTDPRELALALGAAVGQTYAAIAERRGAETFVPGRQRYGGRSVVIRASGVPIVVAGAWLKGRGVYGLIVEAAYVQGVVLATAAEAAALASMEHN